MPFAERKGPNVMSQRSPPSMRSEQLQPLESIQGQEGIYRLLAHRMTSPCTDISSWGTFQEEYVTFINKIFFNNKIHFPSSTPSHLSKSIQSKCTGETNRSS